MRNKDKPKYFKTKIKVLRAEREITQEELSEAVGVSRTTILEIERGTFNPSLKLSFKISNYFYSVIVYTAAIYLIYRLVGLIASASKASIRQ